MGVAISQKRWQDIWGQALAIASSNPMGKRASTSARHRPPRILIIEDELLVALMIEEMLRGLGYRVSAIVRTIAEARLAIAKRNFDVALVDLNLDDEYHPETADILIETSIPFAFVTGYDYIVELRHEKIPLLQKPFTPDQLSALIKTLVGPEASSDETAKTA